MPFTFLLLTPYTSQCFDMYSLVPLIMPTAFISLQSNLVSSPTCPYCHAHDETAEHILARYSTLLRLFSIVGPQWPNCFYTAFGSNRTFNTVPLLHNVGLSYTVYSLAHDTHHMFLHILLARHTATQVLRSTPLTPPRNPHNPLSPHTILSSPSSCVQLPGDVSPISLMSSPG